MGLPRLLAGPILRRTTTKGVAVWIATSEAVRPALTVYTLDDSPGGFVRGGTVAQAGDSQSTSHRLGKRLWVHLVEARPADGRGFPTGRMLGYELRLDDQPLSQELIETLRYGRFRGPSFFIPAPGGAARILYGSCRKAHGRGHDALAYGDAEIAAHASDPGQRPGALFLTGDQIYADDVPGPLITRITELAGELVPDEPPVPRQERLLDVIPAHRRSRWRRDEARAAPVTDILSELPVYRRGDWIHDETGFTSGAASNHLISFGEYMALTLMQWNAELWPAFSDMKAERDRVIPRPRIVIGNNHQAFEDYWAAQHTYEEEYFRCLRMRRVLDQVRRVLANCPTYMVFDDHDITDDWNITREWRDGVMGSHPAGEYPLNAMDACPPGRRIVANGLAAYWACQGWGNDPGVFDQDFIDGVTAFAPSDTQEDDTTRAHRLTEAVLSHKEWAFVAPTEPRTLFLDTRTRRHMEGLGDDKLPWLIEPDALERLNGLLAAGDWRTGDPLLVVSATPVLGLSMVEDLQRFLDHVTDAANLDFEAWTASLEGLGAFLGALLRLSPGRCTILSGDVHYGFTTRGVFEQGGRSLAIEQLTASSFKNESAHVAKVALGKFLDWDKHARLAGGGGTDAWSLSREKFLHADNGGDPLTLDAHIGLLEIEGGAPVRNHLLSPGRWTITLSSD